MDDKKKELIDSLVELCEKNKIVWINDIVRERIEVDKKVKDEITKTYLSGQIRTLLTGNYAYVKKLMIINTPLGETKKNSLAILLFKNLDYYKRCLKKYDELKNKLDKYEKEINIEKNKIKRQILRIGGRYV